MFRKIKYTNGYSTLFYEVVSMHMNKSFPICYTKSKLGETKEYVIDTYNKKSYCYVTIETQPFMGNHRIIVVFNHKRLYKLRKFVYKFNKIAKRNKYHKFKYVLDKHYKIKYAIMYIYENEIPIEFYNTKDCQCCNDYNELSAYAIVEYLQTLKRMIELLSYTSIK